MMQMSLKKTCFAVPPSFVEFQKVGLLEQGRGGDAQHLQTRSHGWWIQNITKKQITITRRMTITMKKIITITMTLGW